MKDRKSKEAATEETEIIQNRLKQHKIIISIEGPLNNVLKFKPPMTFSRKDADYLVEKLDDSLKDF